MVYDDTFVSCTRAVCFLVHTTFGRGIVPSRLEAVLSRPGRVRLKSDVKFVRHSESPSPPPPPAGLSSPGAEAAKVVAGPLS